jgi:1-acyl-sn-glycerol-3-phosphate acyltransferase
MKDIDSIGELELSMVRLNVAAEVLSTVSPALGRTAIGAESSVSSPLDATTALPDRSSVNLPLSTGERLLDRSTCQPDLPAHATGDRNHEVDSGSIRSRVLPWLSQLLYPVARRLVLPTYFGSVVVEGLENIPTDCHALLFAPTHRSRWDAIVVPCAVGQPVCGRDLHFMVSANEANHGLQSWFIQRMGGFAVDTLQPSVASIRHGIKVLEAGKSLVVFPEGDIFRDGELHPLKPGLARMALQAERNKPGVHIVPVHLAYGQPDVPWRCGVRVMIGQSLPLSRYTDRPAKAAGPIVMDDLRTALLELAERSSQASPHQASPQTKIGSN